MAEVGISADDAGEYSREPVYRRPPNASLVTAVERVAQGKTHTLAMQET